MQNDFNKQPYKPEGHKGALAQMRDMPDITVRRAAMLHNQGFKKPVANLVPQDIYDICLHMILGFGGVPRYDGNWQSVLLVGQMADIAEGKQRWPAAKTLLTQHDPAGECNFVHALAWVCGEQAGKSAEDVREETGYDLEKLIDLVQKVSDFRSIYSKGDIINYMHIRCTYKGCEFSAAMPPEAYEAFFQGTHPFVAYRSLTPHLDMLYQAIEPALLYLNHMRHGFIVGEGRNSHAKHHAFMTALCDVKLHDIVSQIAPMSEKIFRTDKQGIGGDKNHRRMRPA